MACLVQSQAHPLQDHHLSYGPRMETYQLSYQNQMEFWCLFQMGCRWSGQAGQGVYFRIPPSRHQALLFKLVAP